ncbi:A24 family peptidase [Microlunatus ginsengisoli]|uniref:A24 family peptidase n=1 Tax=Microlunatus ginsengisoli TaxID=363863 RepID=UPI0031D119F5
MSGPWVALLPAAATAVLTGLAAGPILRRMPEPPAGEPDVDRKLPYAALADGRFALGCALVALALGWTSWALLPPRAQPPWVVLASVGTILALVDLRTTWLPLRLTRIGWLAMLLAVLLVAGLAADPAIAARGLVGGFAAGALYAIVWAVSRGGFGFGDVRFALLIGAAAGTVSWPLLIWALFLGSVLGGVIGLVLLARGRRQGFPYAPAMLLGCYLALAVLTLG